MVRAAVFFAAAARAAAAVRAGAPADPLFSTVTSIDAFGAGSTTTSPVGAAFSAAAFDAAVFAAVVFAAAVFGAAVFDAVLFDAPALDAADFDAAVFAAEVLAGVRLACADFAGVRTAVVFFAADADAGGCFEGESLFADELSGEVSVWSTWAVRSSGEAVTVLRYQWVAASQGRRAINCPRIPQIRYDPAAPGTLCVRCVLDHEMTTGAP
ncbi:hypothetical protein CQ045_15480 [Microbacterium sp. MYb66]|nr:hypothetical protein CQ045_15480 [Microbacterium sp. MYb66]